MKQPLQIAIDGPVAAGKGDIAERLANKLGLVYLYTGAMYRTLALACLRNGVSTKDAQKVIVLLNKSDIKLVAAGPHSGQTFKLLLNGEDVTDNIFDQEIAQGSSDVSTIPEVRQVMVTKQKQLATGRAVVAEGRDIGLRVLPHAQLKIFLTASLEERARRRFKQIKARGIDKTYSEVLKDTRERDHQDLNRFIDPLQKLPDAWELDTTILTKDEVMEKIEEELRRRHLV